MALVVLLPIFTLISLWTIKKGEPAKSSWRTVVALQLILSVSAWFAAETGEDDEDYYEHGIAEHALEEHEEIAEGFQAFALVALPVAALGLVAGKIGQVARLVYLAVTIGLLVVGAMVGHRGGKIIYPDGAQATAEKLTGESSSSD